MFTNGTLLDGGFYELLNKSRNLLPFLSLEGEKAVTDARRGQNIYDTLLEKMDSLKKRGIIYGASITLTKENIMEVTGDAFLGRASHARMQGRDIRGVRACRPCFHGACAGRNGTKISRRQAL